HTGDQVVGDVAGQRAQLDDLDVQRLAARGDLTGDRAGDPVGEQARRRRLAQAAGDDDELLGHRAPPTETRSGPILALGWSGPAASSVACVGGSDGTCAGRRASNSLRSTGTTSSPRMSSCSSTVLRGRPAWSMRNIWRW